MAITANKYITVYGIKDVVLPIGVVCAIILWMKSQTNKLIVYFLFGCQAGIRNKLLYQGCTNLSIAVFGKYNQTICTVGKIIVVRFDTLKERGEVVVRITEVVQLDDFT